MVSGSLAHRSVTILLSVGVLVGVWVGVLSGSAAAGGKDNAGRDPAKARFDQDGALLRPEKYHKWVFVGAPVTPNDMNNGQAAFPEFHNVYINPWAYRQYKKTGQFPDGTVMLKETASVGTKQAPSGNGYFQGELLGLEAAVKDSKQFPNEPGHWAYFSFGKHPNLAASAKAHPTASCNVCHQANTEDWVFTQYYPVLRAAKPH